MILILRAVMICYIIQTVSRYIIAGNFCHVYDFGWNFNCFPRYSRFVSGERVATWWWIRQQLSAISIRRKPRICKYLWLKWYSESPDNVSPNDSIMYNIPVLCRLAFEPPKCRDTCSRNVFCTLIVRHTHTQRDSIDHGWSRNVHLLDWFSMIIRRK